MLILKTHSVVDGSMSRMVDGLGLPIRWTEAITTEMTFSMLTGMEKEALVHGICIKHFRCQAC